MIWQLLRVALRALAINNLCSALNMLRQAHAVHGVRCAGDQRPEPDEHAQVRALLRAVS